MRRTEDIVKDRDVIVVGPAGCLIEDCRGVNVDGYDVVCRLNDHWRMDTDGAAGYRTDIIYHCLGPSQYDTDDIVSWKEKGIHVVYRDNLTKIVLEIWERRNGAIGFDVDNSSAFFKELRYKMGLNPSTGVMAILHILDLGAKSVSCIGFDFYNTLYADREDDFLRSHIINGYVGNHHPKTQFVKFAEMIRSEERFIPIGTLKGMLEEYWNR